MQHGYVILLIQLICVCQLLQACPTTEVYMNSVMEHFQTKMVPSILLLQKASTSMTSMTPTGTVVAFVKKIITIANSLSDKTEVRGKVWNDICLHLYSTFSQYRWLTLHT